MALRVLADDLTGALDAGACFAANRGPLPVHWRPDRLPDADDLIIDTETRHLPKADALARLDRYLPSLAAADLAFKKVDSLMRGNSAKEIAACVCSSRFGSVVIAPAFPAQRRVTRQGQQYAWRADAARWDVAGPNLLAALPGRAAGHAGRPALHVPRELLPHGRGVFICDAETEDDLSRLAGAAGRLAPPTLWCGTAGLAHALAGPARRLVPPRAERIFALVGSHHPMARAQVAELARRWPDAVVRARLDTPHNAITERVVEALEQNGVALLLPSPSGATPQQARVLLSHLLARLRHSVQPDACFASGGATLQLLLDAIGCESAVVAGEIEAGLPLARIKGGAWDRCTLVSKAGAFGTSETLRSLLEHMRGEGTA